MKIQFSFGKSQVRAFGHVSHRTRHKWTIILLSVSHLLTDNFKWIHFDIDTAHGMAWHGLAWLYSYVWMGVKRSQTIGRKNFNDEIIIIIESKVNQLQTMTDRSNICSFVLATHCVDSYLNNAGCCLLLSLFCINHTHTHMHAPWNMLKSIWSIKNNTLEHVFPSSKWVHHPMLWSLEKVLTLSGWSVCVCVQLMKSIGSDEIVCVWFMRPLILLISSGVENK